MSKKNVRLESLFTLSEIISPVSDRENVKQKILSGSIDWLSIVEISNSHFLTAALYYSLLDKNLLKLIDDEELLHYLEQIYTINLYRNQQIIEQSKEIAKILSKKSIKPVFLKGAASLLQNDYKNTGMRFLSDIDFCIYEDVLQEADKLLTSAGYIPQGTPNKDYSLHHHLTPMFHPKWDIPIEPHRKILSYPFLNAIKCEEINCQKTIVGANTYILNPTLRLIHTYMHSDIIDRNYYMKNIDLRQLYEMSLILVNYKKQIDWSYLEDFFLSHDLWDKFNYKLYLASKLFSIDTPIMKENYRTKLHLKVLYLYFKYDDTFLKKLLFFPKYIDQFSYKNIRGFYAAKTTKAYIYFSIKHFRVLIKRLFNKIF